MSSTKKLPLSFGIRNFRSIGDKPVFLNNISKINLFIGKNNSGKSNFLKFINIISGLKNYSEFPTNIENQHKRNGKRASILLSFSVEELNFPKVYEIITGTNPWRRAINYRDVLDEKVTIEFDFVENKIEFDEKFRNLPPEATNNLSNHFKYHSNSADSKPETYNYFKNWAIKNGLQLFKNVIYIPDFRFIKEGVTISQTNTEINGSNIISEVFKMQNPAIGEESKKEQFNLIQETVRDMLNIDDLQIEIPHSKDQMIINLNGNRLPLEYFGTGIHELVILCSALIIHNNHIICLEEPEIHLHPELQKKFFNFLFKTNNTYFITTHSNAFLDVANNEVSIYHVKQVDGESTATLCKTNKTTHEILNDLGYKTSDLLQSNGIIWVEGPSDRVYLKKWFELKDLNLIEGIHYSIMFYGGKILSHFSADPEYLEAELIPLFKFNRNAIVIIDSDITPSKKKLNETKQRINQEIGNDHCWITKGKEIENYLSKSTLESWLKSKYQIQYNINLGDKDILDDVLAAAKVKHKYSDNKHKYAKEIIKHITNDDLDVLDLERKLSHIIRIIENWNNK